MGCGIAVRVGRFGPLKILKGTKINLIGIYKITNIVNSKSYIGQSRNIEKRIAKHKKTPFNPNSQEYNNILYKDIRKYGLEKFTFEILEECELIKLNEREIYWIDYYESCNPEKGYNLSSGGDNNAPGKIKDKVNEIINILRNTNTPIIEIAKMYKVAYGTILDINSGISWHNNDNNYPIRKLNYSTRKLTKYRPSKEEILKDLYNTRNIKTTASNFNLSIKLFRRWCKEINLNLEDNNYIDIYRVEYLNLPPEYKEEKIEKKIYQLDPKTKEIIKIWDSKKDILQYLKIKEVSIGNLNKENKKKLIYKGFNWEIK